VNVANAEIAERHAPGSCAGFVNTAAYDLGGFLAPVAGNDTPNMVRSENNPRKVASAMSLEERERK
jgi:hypothetical protein